MTLRKPGRAQPSTPRGVLSRAGAPSRRSCPPPHPPCPVAAGERDGSPCEFFQCRARPQGHLTVDVPAVAHVRRATASHPSCTGEKRDQASSAQIIPPAFTPAHGRLRRATATPLPLRHACRGAPFLRPATASAYQPCPRGGASPSPRGTAGQPPRLVWAGAQGAVLDGAARGAAGGAAVPLGRRGRGRACPLFHPGNRPRRRSRRGGGVDGPAAVVAATPHLVCGWGRVGHPPPRGATRPAAGVHPAGAQCSRRWRAASRRGAGHAAQGVPLRLLYAACP